MAKKVNYSKNGQDYFRVTASVGRDINGKLIRKEFYGKNKKDAEEKRDEYINNIKNGLNLNFDKVYFGDLMHTWLFEVTKVKVKPSSFERYESIFRNYVQGSILYNIKINNIKQLEIQRYYNDLYKNGKSSNTIKFLNKLLKSFFSYAVEEGYIMKNPCNSKLIIPGFENNIKREVEIFNEDEINVLKKALQGHRLKCLILLALGTGLRQGELLALTWDDIDFNNREIKVEKTIKRVKIFNTDGNSEGHKILIQSPKSQTSNRIVPIPSDLIKIIKSHKLRQDEGKLKAGDSYKNNNLIFATATGNPISAKNLFMSYKNLLIKAKIEHKKFHALRHTYATKLFEVNVPLKTVQTLLGHSDISITADIYTHVMPKEKITAVEKLNSLFK